MLPHSGRRPDPGPQPVSVLLPHDAADTDAVAAAILPWIDPVERSSVGETALAAEGARRAALAALGVLRARAGDACTCDEAGPGPWCDVHGMPSSAYAAGMAAGAAQLEAAARRCTDTRTAGCLLDVARGLRALAAL